MIGFLLFILFIFVVWLFLIGPRISKRAEIKELKKYDYAHRGLHNIEKGVPENSLKAFRMAAEAGFGMELDVQLTRDRKVIVHHDADLIRSCGVHEQVDNLSLEEIKQLRLFDTDEEIPTFEETLNAVGRRVPIIIEIKSYSEPEVICPIVWEVLESYEGEYCIESFDPRIVRWFKESHPYVVRGQLMQKLQHGKEDNLTRIEAFAGRNMLSNFLTRPDFEAYDYHARNIPSMKLARGIFRMQEVSWTVKDWKTYKLLKADKCICIFEGFEPTKEAEREEQTEEIKIPAQQATAHIEYKK